MSVNTEQEFGASGGAGALMWGSMGATYGAALGPLGYSFGSGQVVEDINAVLE